MRRKAFVLRTIGISLACVLFSLISFAQTETSSDEALREDGEKEKSGAKNAFTVAQSSSLLFLLRNPDSGFKNFVSSEINPISAGNFRRSSALGENLSSPLLPVIVFRSGGLQTFFSAATGITQISEIQLLERRGLVSSNGQRPTSNSFTVEGMSANLGVSADETSISGNAGALPALTASDGTNSLLPGSATQEIVVKAMSTAKEQRVAGSQINLVTRSGTNEFHGTLFETFGNEILNANDFFANARGFGRAPSRLNQFGGTFGGFLVRDKVFFFGNYEGLRLRQAAFAVSEVPDFSSRLNASALVSPILGAFPLANGQNTSGGFAEFAAVYANPAANDIFGWRIDWRPTSRLNIRGRYNFADSEASLRGDKNFSLNTRRESRIKTESFLLSASRTLSSTMVASGGINFSRNRIDQQFSIDDFGGADVSAINFATPFDFLKYDFAGKNSALALGSPIESTLNQFQANGLFEWIKSHHQLSFGGDFRRLALDVGAARSERSILFAGISRSLDGAAARVAEMRRDFLEKPVLHDFSLFAQDSWRIMQRLNLSLGLRWDGDFAPKIEAPLAGFQNSTPQMQDNLKNFAPRVSAAFNLLENGKAVIRGGAGLYFDYGNSAASEIFANSYPFLSGSVARNAAFNATPANPLNPLLTFAENLKTPRTWHIFAEYQQEFFRNHIFTATYTASAGRKLFLTRTFLNADPTFGYVRLTNNDAESDFQSLQFRFERRFAQNFSINARYTLSKSKDNFSPVAAVRETNFVAADLDSERGASDFDVRQQFHAYGVFEIPTFFDGGWKQALAEDWSISAVANARSSFPVNVGYFRVNDFGKEYFRADPVANAPLYLNNNAIKSLDPNAFSIPSAARQGTLERNRLRGFPFFQLDASLQRRIRFTNQIRLELAINAYNLLNNTNFADLSGNLGTMFSGGDFQPNYYFGKTNSTFGSNSFTPFNLYGGARTIQLTAKFVF